MNPLSRPNLPVFRSSALCLAGAALALVLTGCNSAPGKPPADPEVPRPEQVLDFNHLYNQNCASCHGVNGRNGAAISLANPTYLAIAGLQDIERITADGVKNTTMPAFAKHSGGMLTDQQIQIISQGMIQRWGQPNALAGQNAPAYAANGQGNADQGQKAFTQYCARCHGADGTAGQTPRGEKLGSIVDPAYLSLVSDQGLRSLILAGQFDGTPHDWRTYQNGHPMSDQEVTDVVAWLTSHRVPAPGQPYTPQP